MKKIPTAQFVVTAILYVVTWLGLVFGAGFATTFWLLPHEPGPVRILGMIIVSGAVFVLGLRVSRRWGGRLENAQLNDWVQ